MESVEWNAASEQTWRAKYLSLEHGRLLAELAEPILGRVESGARRDRGRMMEFQTAGDVLESKKAKFGIGRPVKCRACDSGTFRQYVGCDNADCASRGMRDLLAFYKRQTLEKLGAFFNEYIPDKAIAARVGRIMYSMKAGVKRLPTSP